MADRTLTLEVTGLMNTATNWAADTKPATGDTIVLNAALNAPNGYADGEALTAPLTDVAGTFGLSLAGGAVLSLSDILGDLANQAISTVTLVGATYTHDATEAVTGAVTVDTTSTYQVGAAASHTVTGGITNTAGEIIVGDNILSSAIVLVGGLVDLTSAGGIVGAVTATAAGNEFGLGEDGSIVGTVDMGANDCTWSGTGILTVNATSDLVLGGAAVGLDIVIKGTAQTITAGDAALSCKSLTLNAGTYVAAATTHTVADKQEIRVTGSTTLTLTDAGLHVHIIAGTCTLGGALTCAGIRVEAGATLTGGGNDVIMTDSADTVPSHRLRITGGGTVTNIDPTGPAIHLGPGITQGAGNTNVVVDTYQDGGLEL